MQNSYLQVKQLKTKEDVLQEIKMMGYDTPEEFVQSTGCKSDWLNLLLNTYAIDDEGEDEPEEALEPAGKGRFVLLIGSTDESNKARLFLDEINFFKNKNGDLFVSEDEAL